jgi:hypothetical protein
METAFRGKASDPRACDHFSLPCRSWRTARQTVRGNLSSIGKHGNLRVDKHFDLANDSVAAMKLSSATRLAAQSIAMHTNGIDMFENFDWSVERVRHVAVCGVSSVGAGARTGATRNCFVVGKGGAIVSRVSTPEREIIHRALAGGWNSRGNRACQRPEQRVHDTLRSFHVSSSHSSR